MKLRCLVCGNTSKFNIVLAGHMVVRTASRFGKLTVNYLDLSETYVLSAECLECGAKLGEKKVLIEP